MITSEDLKLQAVNCKNCKAKNNTYCITNNCPYWTLKHYTEEDKELAKKVMGKTQKK